MSDFGSLLKQFQRDGLEHNGSDRSRRQDDENQQSRKRSRVADAASFPPVEEIYLICPGGVQTGGPEALHQLCDQLNATSSVTAFMVYVRSFGSVVSHAPRSRKPAAYEPLYNAPVVVDWDPLTEPPSQRRLFIWPECWTDEMLNYLNSYTLPTPCAVWWLSVDNNNQRFQDWHRKDILHLYQSEYAKQHLQKHGATYIYAMTEYISSPPTTISSCDSRNIDILYNPLKGMHYTDAIRKRSESVMNFRPIGGDRRERISPEQVRQLLTRAKIYIDFGPHPGMDRLPREAALCGCLVVTNRVGAAYYDEDVPLPAKYKIGEFHVDHIHKLLQDSLEHFEMRSKELDEYRNWIRGQRGLMKDCVSNLLTEIVTNRKKS